MRHAQASGQAAQALRNQESIIIIAARKKADREMGLRVAQGNTAFCRPAFDGHDRASDRFDRPLCRCLVDIVRGDERHAAVSFHSP